uniref:Exosome complex component RRP45 n=1 Tax=Triatoma dimidiata TaxID=72491 RepID=A0A0V0GAR4_TRIDM
MKDTVLSNCEKEFVVNAIRCCQRLDGRDFDKFRNIEINFGADYGSAAVSIGETKAVAQVTCELNEPRAIRPNEGLLFINVDINEMVCSEFDTGHQSHLAVHVNRIIEKCIRESGCVDVEALCIISEEQVWDIRLDVTVLNYDGNLLSCCSIAALAALMHFKTPNISVENYEITVHSMVDHEPVPLSINHYPILLTFAVFCNGEHTLLDPTGLEEKVSEAELVFGMNSYREVCAIHFSGKAIGNKSLILNCANKAANVAVELVNKIKNTVDEDHKKRLEMRGHSEGFSKLIHLDRILAASRDREVLKISYEYNDTVKESTEKKEETSSDLEKSEITEDNDSAMERSDNESVDSDKIFTRDKHNGIRIEALETKELCPEWEPSGNKDAWQVGEDESEVDDDDNDDDVNYVGTITNEDRIIDNIELSGDSEEETVRVLEGKDL